MLELTDGQAFNASMEHMYENQQPDETASYEQYVQNIHYGDQTVDEIISSVKQFSKEFLNEMPEELETLGRLMNGAIQVSPEVIDSENMSAAQRMFTNGAMTGLYIGSQMAGEYMSSANVLSTSHELIKDDVYKFVEDATTFAAHMNPITKHILDQWKAQVEGDGQYGALFDVGFGVIMCSVNKTLQNIYVLNELEANVDWDDIFDHEGLPYRVEPVDEICSYLVERLHTHAAALKLSERSGEDLDNAVDEASKLLELDLEQISDLEISDRVQTQGFGLYVGFENVDDDDGFLYEIKEGTNIRATVTGIECVRLPTQEAIVTDQLKHVSAYVPYACLTLEDVEIVDVTGESVPIEGAIGLPLSKDGPLLNKIIYPTGKS